MYALYMYICSLVKSHACRVLSRSLAGGCGRERDVGGIHIRLAYSYDMQILELVRGENSASEGWGEGEGGPS